MLVLSRKRDEKVLIGDDVVICVVDIRGDKVRLGIDAPPEVPVHREEVATAIRAESERRAAAVGLGARGVERIAASFQRITPATPEPTFLGKLAAGLAERFAQEEGAYNAADWLTILKEVADA